MEAKVQNGLKLIGYTNPAVNDDFPNIIKEGPKNAHYTHIVSFVTQELKSLCNMDEEVNPITCPEDYVSFLMELSSFLKELGCPYESMIQGHISERLSTTDEKLLLLDYLITELMAARMLREKVPEKNIELKLNESNNAANLRKLLMTLGFSRPPPNITATQLFQKIIPTVENIVKKGGPDLLGNPIFNVMLNDKQWHVLSKVQGDLHNEYTIRRKMLLTRLDCTIQSFQWSDKMKGKEADINKKYAGKRKELKVEPDVGLADLLCAREDLAIIEKTSSATVRKNTQTAINKVIIGQVPDRGGRTSEQAPPPPEMPSWQQRSAGPSGGRGGGSSNARGGGFSSGRGGGQGRGGYGAGDRGSHQDYYNKGNTYSNQSNTTFDSAGSYNANYNRVSSSNYVQSTNTSYNDNHNTYSKDYNKNYDNYLKGNSDNYSRGNNESYSRGNSDNYSRGSRSNDNYSRDYNDSRGDNYTKGNNDSYNSRNSGGNNLYGRGNQYTGGFDSAGSYGGYQDYSSNEPKRAKTYDYFQNNKSTYADQYVQESQHNQQYQSREFKNRGRGKSNYNRGNNRNYY